VISCSAEGSVKTEHLPIPQILYITFQQSRKFIWNPCPTSTVAFTAQPKFDSHVRPPHIRWQWCRLSGCPHKILIILCIPTQLPEGGYPWLTNYVLHASGYFAVLAVPADFLHRPCEACDVVWIQITMHKSQAEEVNRFKMKEICVLEQLYCGVLNATLNHFVQ
jgi:hypothetical protein